MALAFRTWGHLEARLDPLGRIPPCRHPELAVDSPAAEPFRRWYCGPIGVEFMHIPEPERREWIQERMERDPEPVDPEPILDALIRADVFEQVLHRRYLGAKRFSIKGTDALVPLLREMFQVGAELGAERVIFGMSHRGRLNVVVHVVGRSPKDIFAGFEDVDPRSVLGGGDVKYHLGATGRLRTRSGKEVAVHLVSNPSHLEAVDPVVVGRARAWQTRVGDREGRRILPLQVHGDAAFAGQGIAAETLNLAGLEGFSVGGSLHVVVNNLIGFTATPEKLHSSRYATDVAKRLPVPIFHVNGEDPDAVIRAARLAVEYRYTFGTDVVLDLIGYRLYGHSEIDDPTMTQPLLYRKIAALPPLWQSYGERHGWDVAALEQRVAEVQQEYEALLEEARRSKERPVLIQFPPHWQGYVGGRYHPEYEVETALPAVELRRLAERLTTAPEHFHVHPKVQRLLEQRREMGEGKRPVDYGMAEALAFASLVEAGYHVRLSGQDSRRGTFSHRHSYLIDVESGDEYCPLQHLPAAKGRFECYDSALSEAAILGFEYGFSRDYPDGLILWEAQFGDFANGAQVIIDQFIAAGEEKWELLSGLVLLLPHGYEGQGPEHSSARVERFLQLAARDNLQIAQPSTAAQYFHLLRRQALRKWRKPLVVFTPKSMLRHPAAASPLEDLASGAFQWIRVEPAAGEVERIFFCTGKIGHELKKARDERGDTGSAIVFVEQLYPFPDQQIRDLLRRYTGVREVVWVQEEPANMGALFFVEPRLRQLASGKRFRSVKRSASGTPATGSARAHEVEQSTLLAVAFARLE
ncbi:MAG: 2-oxoglutarate dehydrogenase E1 component [Acidobacteriota bacterium]